MLVEWDAHNDVLSAANFAKSLGLDISDEDIYRLEHTDFDYNDENTTYWQYWQRALKGVY